MTRNKLDSFSLWQRAVTAVVMLAAAFVSQGAIRFFAHPLDRKHPAVDRTV